MNNDCNLNERIAPIIEAQETLTKIAYDPKYSKDKALMNKLTIISKQLHCYRKVIEYIFSEGEI